MSMHVKFLAVNFLYLNNVMVLLNIIKYTLIAVLSIHINIIIVYI